MFSDISYKYLSTTTHTHIYIYILLTNFLFDILEVSPTLPDNLMHLHEMTIDY